jgi:hypothetical protein
LSKLEAEVLEGDGGDGGGVLLGGGVGELIEAAFVSAAHGEAEVSAILAAADSALHEVLR